MENSIFPKIEILEENDKGVNCISPHQYANIISTIINIKTCEHF